MKKMISKTARIRNLMSRVINEDKKKQYERASVAIALFKEQSKKVASFHMEDTDQVVLSSIHQYIALADELKKEILPLPVLHDYDVTAARVWYEDLCKIVNYGAGPKGKELKGLFANVKFAFEKWISVEINAREI